MRRLELLFNRGCRILFTSLYRREPIDPTKIPVDTFKRILVIRQHDQLGDLMMITPALRALRKRFPKAFIAAVVREFTAPLIYNNPSVDAVLVFSEKFRLWNYSKLRSFWNALRGSGGFDCTIVFNTVSRSFSSDIVALLSGAKYIVGPDHIPLVPGRPEKVYNVSTQRSQKIQHEIDHNLDILRPLGVTPDGYEFDLVLTSEEEGASRTIYINMNLPKSKPVIGFHFGTLDVQKQFPLDTLSQIIDRCVEKYTATIVLIIGPGEEPLRRHLISLLRHKVFSAPLMPLRIVAGFLKNLDLLVCNDTGTLHIASSQRVSTVSFHSVGDPVRWKPPHDRHIAVRASDAAITSITVDEAMAAIAKALGRNTR